ESGEPAGREVVPRTRMDDAVIADAETPALGERGAGHLEEADSGGGRRVEGERIPGPAPPPRSTCERIALALRVSERGQKLGADQVRCMGPERRSVACPGLARCQRRRREDEPEELRRLTSDLVG